MYEHDEAPPKGVVATPGTILDYVAKNLNHFLPIIKQAGKLPFYNTIDYRYTLFVPVRLPENFPIDINTALKLLRMSTMPGVITTDMLSNNQILFPISRINNLYINKCENGEIKVNGLSLIKGDIKCKNGTIHLVDGILWPS